MPRNRASAKKAGASFERAVADYLRDNLDDRIDRKVLTGAKDTGDIANVRSHAGLRVTIECKNTVRTDLSGWMTEAVTECANSSDDIPAVVFKRHGVGAPGSQWVLLTLDSFTTILRGK
jgi:hypothetical protein